MAAQFRQLAFQTNQQKGSIEPLHIRELDSERKVTVMRGDILPLGAVGAQSLEEGIHVIQDTEVDVFLFVNAPGNESHQVRS